jgi:hypothetical protein
MQMIKKLSFVLLLSCLWLITKGQGSNTDTTLLSNNKIATADTNNKYFFCEENYKDSLQHYQTLFGANKNIADSLKLPFFVALSYYPELYAAKIDVESKMMFTTMEARPSTPSVFRKKRKRVYKIFINNRKGTNKGVNLAKLNFNTRVGFFGHELAHLLSYQMRNGAQLVGMGFKYVFSKKYKRLLERQTDLETINRGLGFALYESKKLILKSDDADVPPDYRLNASKHYMTDEEVLDAIRHLPYKSLSTSTHIKY